MSVVVYRGGVMAADSQSYEGDTRWAPFVKVRVVIARAEDAEYHGARLVAGAVGENWCCTVFFDWLARGDASRMSWPDVARKDHFEALVATPWGELHHYDASGAGAYDLVTPWLYGVAIGAGAREALGALWRGASAVEAVEAAVALHIACGAPVRSERVEPALRIMT